MVKIGLLSGCHLELLMLWLSKERNHYRFNCATFRYHGPAIYVRDKHRKMKKFLDGQKIHGNER